MHHINIKNILPDKSVNFITHWFKRLFIEHPESVHENYFEHLGHAVFYGLRMITAGMICIIHAIIPGVFLFTASNMMKNLIEEINQRNNKMKVVINKRKK